jgi:serine/threonine-protein phosphatase 2A regulatory subunit A
MLETAAAARHAGIAKVGTLVDAFKGEWIISNFIPKCNEIFNVDKQGYLYRMCVIYSLNSVIHQLTKEQVTQYVAPLLQRACKDPIPNVKFCAAKAVKDIHAKDKLDGPTALALKELL